MITGFHDLPKIGQIPSAPAQAQPCAGVILIPNDHTGVWMNLRINTPDYRGCWQVAGGKIDPNEDAATGAARELYEETGIVVPKDALTPILAKEFVRPTGSRYHSVQFALICRDVPVNTEAHKHSDWQVIPWDQIPQLRSFGPIQEVFGTK